MKTCPSETDHSYSYAELLAVFRTAVKKRDGNSTEYDLLKAQMLGRYFVIKCLDCYKNRKEKKKNGKKIKIK